VFDGSSYPVNIYRTGMAQLKNGMFMERWSITCLSVCQVLAPGKVTCSALTAHTHRVEQCFYAFAICSICLFKRLVPYSYSTKFWNCCAFLPITYTYTLFHVTCLALWDVLHIYCIIWVYGLNRPFCIACSCVINTASQHVWGYSRNSDLFVVRLNPSVIS
jgi:hypothetical protein